MAEQYLALPVEGDPGRGGSGAGSALAVQIERAFTLVAHMMETNHSQVPGEPRGEKHLRLGAVQEIDDSDDGSDDSDDDDSDDDDEPRFAVGTRVECFVLEDMDWPNRGAWRWGVVSALWVRRLCPNCPTVP
jgi:hypothetical protein